MNVPIHIIKMEKIGGIAINVIGHVLIVMVNTIITVMNVMENLIYMKVSVSNIVQMDM